MNRTPITPDVRQAVFAAWGGKCAYCRDAPAQEVDHIFPRSQGGPDALENYAPACQRCNRRKSDLLLAEGFLRIIEAQAISRKGKVLEILANPSSASNRARLTRVFTSRQGHRDMVDLIAKSPTAACILHWMIAHSERDNTVLVELASLPTILQCTDRSVRSALKVLTEGDWISLKRQSPKGRPRLYQVNKSVLRTRTPQRAASALEARP